MPEKLAHTEWVGSNHALVAPDTSAVCLCPTTLEMPE